MKYSDFKCECGGSGLSDDYVEGFGFEPCPCNKRTAIEIVDLKIPEGYFYTGIKNNFAHFVDFNDHDSVVRKLPYKQGEMFVCEVCERCYVIDNNRVACNQCDDKPIKAQCTMTVEGKQLKIEWREV